MDSLSTPRRLYLNYLSRAYATMYMLNYRTFLGIRLSSLVRWVPIILLVIGWLQLWPAPLLVGLLIVVVWVNFSLWRAKRDNYNRFVPDGGSFADDADLGVLPANEKVNVTATGIFSVSGRDKSLLFHPATYWRVPLGEHVVMVEEQAGKYLYQFFNARSLQTLQSGWLLYGSRPVEVLAVTFLARWGPEFTRFGQSLEDVDESELPPPKRVTIYLSTSDEPLRQVIRQTIVSDARQARLDMHE
ncbi:MAG: hypothetical protein KA586_01605 [Candidatus Promineofilum sp.]|nr:hypothetical protein [Promineifilum sp.]